MLLFCNMAVMTLPDRQLWGFIQGSQSLKHPESHCLSFNNGHDNIITKMMIITITIVKTRASQARCMMAIILGACQGSCSNLACCTHKILWRCFGVCMHVRRVLVEG